MKIAGKAFNDMPWEQMLARNSQEELTYLLERLGIADAWRNSLQEPQTFLEGYFLDNPESFLQLFSEETFDLLLDIWDEKHLSELVDIDRKHLIILEKFGFLEYNDRTRTIEINREAKNNFYFLFKSRAAQKQKERYREMEYTVKGILYFYGIVVLTQMYDIIKKQYDIPFSEFSNFLKARMELWDFLGIFKDTQREEYYAVSYEVRERNRIFAEHMRRPEQDYATLDAEDAAFLGRMSGVGNWRGTAQLLEYSLKVLYEDAMPATVFVKTILMDIQNGNSLEMVRRKLYPKMEDFSEEEKETVLYHIKEMYWHTPIYQLKGHSRYETEEKANRFSIIEGGRRD